MIIIPVREGENIDRALKRYKRKFEKTGRMKEIRNRKQFNKKSELRRRTLQKAVYKQHLQVQEENN
ncbi:MAG: 30S ribosomal protein S21 [Salinivirgaceae bacterium]|jgi:small subunit ribosomal protein S21|nr:30S ribosomal protein S21 [Bacteroidales bacterium]